MAYATILNRKLMEADSLIALGSCLLCSFKAYEMTYNISTDPLQRFQETVWRYVTYKRSEKEDSKQETVKKDQ